MSNRSHQLKVSANCLSAIVGLISLEQYGRCFQTALARTWNWTVTLGCCRRRSFASRLRCSRALSQVSFSVCGTPSFTCRSWSVFAHGGVAATLGNQSRAADLLGLNRTTPRKKTRDLTIRMYRTGA
jgi:hypothetical protein